MPPLLCPSHSIFDLSKSKGIDELRTVLSAIGEIAELVQTGKANLILTEFLQQFFDGADIYWNQPEPQFTFLREIYTLYQTYFLQRHEGLVMIDVSDIESADCHPVLEGVVFTSLVELWAMEVQRLLVRHDGYIKDNFCIAIPCERAFCGLEKGKFDNPSNNRCFPLIGPSEVNNLIDAYEWIVPNDLHLRNVSPSQIIKNCKALNGRSEIPDGDSHCHIHFGKYRWTFSLNNDPVPDDHLKELEIPLSLPFNVIKSAFLSGQTPRRKLRFEN